jgi:hypothetical protein
MEETLAATAAILSADVIRYFMVVLPDENSWRFCPMKTKRVNQAKTQSGQDASSQYTSRQGHKQAKAQPS